MARRSGQAPRTTSQAQTPVSSSTQDTEALRTKLEIVGGVSRICLGASLAASGALTTVGVPGVPSWLGPVYMVTGAGAAVSGIATTAKKMGELRSLQDPQETEATAQPRVENQPKSPSTLNSKARRAAQRAEQPRNEAASTSKPKSAKTNSQPFHEPSPVVVNKQPQVQATAKKEDINAYKPTRENIKFFRKVLRSCGLKDADFLNNINLIILQMEQGDISQQDAVTSIKTKLKQFDINVFTGAVTVVPNRGVALSVLTTLCGL